MNKKENLVGNKIHLFMEGVNIQFIGEIMEINEKDVVLKLDDGLGFFRRDKVICFLIDFNEDLKTEERVEGEVPSGYDISAIINHAHDDGLNGVESNEIGHGNQYGSLIPGDMLVGEDTDPQVDFSINMHTIKNPPQSYGERDDSREEN